MIGRIIHNYRIEELIGEGGMGTVYRAVDTMLGRDVALKMLHPKLLQQSTFLERFKNEAQILAKLNHPNIAILHNFIKDGEDYFMVMEYVEGQDLESLLKDHGNLPSESVIPIVRQALEGIAHAHKKGILHRDIKPANLILTPEGTVKLMDFGIAKLAGGQKLTQVNRLVGTLEYLSPEQIQGQEPSPQSDIYAVGVLLFELLTGKLPFQGNTDYDLMQKIITHKPLKISELDGSISKNLEGIVSKCLNKKPEQRYVSATGVYEELSRISSSRQITIPAKKQVSKIRQTDEKPLTYKETVMVNQSKTAAKPSKLPFKKEFMILGGAAVFALGIFGWGALSDDEKIPEINDDKKVVIIPQKPDGELPKPNPNFNQNTPKPIQPKTEEVEKKPKNEEKKKENNKKQAEKPVESKPVENKYIESKPVETIPTEPVKTPVVENKIVESKSVSSNKSITLGSNRVTIELLDRVQSTQASEGQNVRFRVASSVVVDGVTVIRSGASARGVVTAIKKATLLRKETLEIRVKDVEASNGQWVSLKAATFRETSTASEGVTFTSGQTFIVETGYAKLIF